MLIARQQVNKWLHLSYRASHRLLDGEKFVQAGQVAALLNSVRQGSQPALHGMWVPSTLLTINQLAAAISNDVTKFTPHQVRNWTRRQRPAPHFALSSRNLLFDKSQVEMWMQYSLCRKPKPATATAADTTTAAAAADSQPQPTQPTE
jgi:hypothetical protein